MFQSFVRSFRRRWKGTKYFVFAGSSMLPLLVWILAAPCLDFSWDPAHGAWFAILILFFCVALRGATESLSAWVDAMLFVSKPIDPNEPIVISRGWNSTPFCPPKG